MGSTDRVDDRTFKVDFSTEGVAKLRERVKDKLKEFMGDYTDDTLVEYVIVLLRNGRRKVEAKNELNIFLGDDSESFVAWLWDHLAESLDEYLHPQRSHAEDTTKKKPLISSQNEKKESMHKESESEKGLSNKLLEDRPTRKRSWIGLPTSAAEPPSLLISSEVHKIHYEEQKDCKGRHDKRSPPPQSRSHRKRDRIDEQQHEQREGKPDVSRRLLQFAVRDALATSKPSNSLTEPSLKRLRSVVSTSMQESSAIDAPRRIQSVARAVNPMATVIKAVAEAAEDVRKTKPRNVFDRLSHSTDESLELDQHVKLTEAAGEVEGYKDLNEDEEEIQPGYPRRFDYNGPYDENMTMSETGLDPNVMSGYGRLNVDANVSYASISGGNKVDNLMNVEHNVAAQADDAKRVKRNNYKRHLNEAASKHKTVSSSGNMDPGKTPKFQEQREVADVGPQRSLLESKTIAGEAILQSSKEKTSTVAIDNGNVKPTTNIQKEAPNPQISGPGAFSSIRPSVDADSRTIFVTNVHFGATKDSLSRHFNKFGEVLKVVIVADPATGQPTGSAYIEFMRKEAADSALSLDGTSFMSRILKIAKGSVAQQEVAPTMTWSRAARGSPYSAARFSRAPYARGIPGAFRGRPPIRPGARSLQWKRGSSAGASAEAGPSGIGNSGLAPGGGARSLTYVRADTKPDVNAATAT